MKITEILVENQSLDEAGIGRGIEKVAGGIGKAAGYIAGIPGGIKKAFQKGKARATAGIGGELPDEPAQSNPDFDKEYSRLTGKGGAAQPAPASGPGSSTAGTTASGGAKTEPDLNAPAGAAKPAAPAQAPSATDINKAGPKGTAPAKPVSGMAKQALAKTAQAVGGQTADQAGQTLYAQVKSQVNQLDKKGKQRILQLLQKSMAQPAQAPAAAPAGAKPAAAPAAAAGNPTAAMKGVADKVKAGAAGKKPAPKQPGKPSQAAIDADRERLMGITSDSVIRKGAAVTESKKFHSLYKK